MAFQAIGMGRILSTIAIPLALLYLSFFASPLCIVYLWGERLIMLKTKTETKPAWRKTILLGAQLMVTAAVTLVWHWLLVPSPVTRLEADKYLRTCFTSLGLAFTAMAASLLGTGTAKGITTASSLLVMLNWLAVAVFNEF